MIAALISSFFAVAACVALGAIAVSLQRYGAQARAIGQQLKAHSPVREVRFTIVTTEVRRSGATIYRPAFRLAAPNLPALRAAA